MADPTPTRNSSKRPLSPSASSPPRDRSRFAPYSDIRFSNTPKSAPMDAPAVRAKMFSLEPDQKDTLLKTLFDLHPAARESIAAILPSIPSIPSPANTITKSVYFGEQVEWCHSYFKHHKWPVGLDEWLEGGICRRASDVLDYSITDIERDLGDGYGELEARKLRDPNYDHEDFSLDGTVALLEIGLLPFERHSGFGPEHPCVGDSPDWSCPQRAKDPCLIYDSLRELGDILLFRLPRKIPHRTVAQTDHGNGCFSSEEMVERFARREKWHIAICYATSDNQPHPLRETLLSYIDLPPILPHPGPNVQIIPQLDDCLVPCLERLAASLREGKMPDREPELELDLRGISIK